MLTHIFQLRLIVLLLLVLGTGAASGQAQNTATCPAVIEQALNTTTLFCGDMQRGQVCYGYPAVTVNLYSGTVEQLVPGARFDVSEVESLRTQPVNLFTGEWGLLRLRLQADLPDDAPDQALDAILFGDTELINAGDLRLQGFTNTIVNLRGDPSTQNASLGRINAGVPVAVVGRNTAGDWLRVVTPPETPGWLFADLVNVTGDASQLPVFADDDLSLAQVGPMQALQLRSNTQGTPCPEAPPAGILLQNNAAQQIGLRVNDVALRMEGTTFIEAQAGDAMRINVLDGQVLVRTSQTTLLGVAGTQVRIPLTDEGLPTGEADILAYTNERLATLPSNSLPTPITIANALTPAELEARLLDQRTPLAGIWQLVAADASDGCPPLTLATGTEISLTVDEAVNQVVIDGLITFDEVTSGVYDAPQPTPDRINVITSSYFVRQTTVFDGACVLTSEFELAGL